MEPVNTQGRILAGCVCVLCLAVLIVAAWLAPSADGHGTHKQLGMSECLWVATLDRPCPTCGMTTAVAYAAHGRMLAGFKAQPFGLLLAIGASCAFWVSLHVAATGSHAARLWAVLLSGRVLWTLAGLLAAAWVYKLATWPG
jgi:hypothetical protein